MRIILIVTALLFHGLTSPAQTKAVNVGDICPDLTISSVINYSGPAAKISDFKGRLLILDFWATWCRPCIAAFPKIDSLQKKFGNKIQILPVTSEGRNAISDFLGKMKNINKVLVPTITDDRELRRLFPHTIVPHCVWINGEGKVVAITDGRQITEANINSMLEGKLASLPLKQDKEDIVAEAREGIPVFMPAYRVRNNDSIQLTGMDKSNLVFNSMISRYMPGLPSGSDNPDSTLLSVYNLSVLQLYQIALWKHGKEILNVYTIIPDIADNTLLKKITGSLGPKKLLISREDWPEWMKENNYCYEIKVPPVLSHQKFDIMLDELNRYFGQRFGIEGAMEKRMTKYLALVRTTTEDKLTTKGGNTIVQSDGSFSLKMQNCNLSWLVGKMRMPLKLYTWLENEAGYAGMVDLELNCQLSDLNAVNKELVKYGLQFVEKEKMKDIAVVRMKKDAAGMETANK
jgi:thiol-disulfide isomerase/thioredoxin